MSLGDSAHLRESEKSAVTRWLRPKAAPGNSRLQTSTCGYGKYLFIACIMADFGTMKARIGLLQMKVTLLRTSSSHESKIATQSPSPQNIILYR